MNKEKKKTVEKRELIEKMLVIGILIGLVLYHIGFHIQYKCVEFEEHCVPCDTLYIVGCIDEWCYRTCILFERA